MHVLVLAPGLYNTSPSQRFRIEQWARYLEPMGFSFTFAPFEDPTLREVIYQRGCHGRKAILTVRALIRRMAVSRSARNFDVVFLHREAAVVGPALIERLIARQRVPIVFDFDDAVWVRYISPANRFLSYLKCFGKTATICRLSTRVIAGNQYLADYAAHYSREVVIVPTTIDTGSYRERPRGDPGVQSPVTIGWTGSYSTVQHLELLRPCLAELGRQLEFRLDVIGTPSYRIDGIPASAQEWRANSEVADLARFDIGIMPLPDDRWSRGKCGLKLLQCMALGIPVVGSAVGANMDIIRDGVNGFLATTEREWREKLSLLIRDPDLRRAIGAAGRQTVEERYAAKVWAPRVADILRAAARVA